MSLLHPLTLWKELPQNVLNGLMLTDGSFIHSQFFVAREIMAEMGLQLRECLPAAVLTFQFIFLSSVIKELKIFKPILQSSINILRLIFILYKMKIIFMQYQKIQ